MSELSGSLADFTLSAVVRLLAAGQKSGILVINGTGLDGSVFFDAGELVYATTRKPNGPDLDTESDRREGADVAVDDMIADVLARLERQGDGSFTFQAGVQPVHEVSQTYDVEAILEMVSERQAVWTDIIQAIGSTDTPFAMSDDLDADEKIELTGLEWNLLSSMGTGTSVSDLSMALRLPELETAEIVVRLKQDNLIEEGHRSTRRVTTPSSNGGGRLYEPDRDEVVVNITDAALAVEETVEEADEDPVSDLAARWRNLRSASRDEVETTS